MSAPAGPDPSVTPHTPSAASEQGDLEVVYALGTPGHQTVKIGTTKNLAKRIADIQRMSPVPLRVLWTYPGGHEVESYLHRHFKAFRSHGEWFTFESDPVELVRVAVEGEPWRKKVSLRKPPILVARRRARAMAARAHGDSGVHPEIKTLLAASVAEVRAIVDPIEQFRAAKGRRETMAGSDKRLAAILREVVIELKDGRSWREVGELLGFSGARAEAIAKGR